MRRSKSCRSVEPAKSSRWTRIMESLGFGGGKKTQSVTKSRGLRLEPLEERQLLAVLVWDPDGNSANGFGGTGNWTGGSYWYNQTTETYVEWNNANNDQAVFQGSAGTVTVNAAVSAAKVTFQDTDGYTISGSNGLTLTGTGETITANQSATISAVISVSADQQWAVTSGKTLSIGSNVDLSSYALTIGGAGNATVTGVMSGSGGSLTKTGAGTLTITSANTYSGPTSINGGALNIRNNNALGNTSGVTVVNGARLELQGGITVSGKSITIDGKGGNNYGALQSVGEALNTWDGNVVLSTSPSDQPRIGATGPDVAHLGTLVITGEISGGSTAYGLGIRCGDDVGGASGGNALGSVILTGVSTYTGPTQIVVGTLKLDGGDNRLPVGTVLTVGNSYNVASATFDLNGYSQQIAGLRDQGTTMSRTVTNSTGTSSTLTVSNAGASTYTSAISGNLALTKMGTGTQVLSGNNTYSGPTSINGGALNIRNNNALGNTSGVTVVNGARLELQGGITVSGKSITIDGKGGNSWGALQSVGTESEQTNTWDGNIILNTSPSDQSRIGACGVSASYPGTLVVTGAITGGSTSYGLGICCGNNTTGYPLGTVVLSGASSYTGPTQIVYGNLKLGGDNCLPVGTVLTMGNSYNVASATFDLNGHSQQIASLTNLGTTMSQTITNDSSTLSTLTVANSAASTYAGVISGNLALAKNGIGTLTLSGTNTYTGGTAIQNGTLRLGTANALPTTATITFGTTTTNGILELNGFNQQVSGLVVASGATAANQIIGNSSTTANSVLTIDLASSSSFAGTIQNKVTGSGTYTTALAKMGTGTLTLSGQNTYTGGTTVTAGVLLVSNLSYYLSIDGNSSVSEGTSYTLNLAARDPGSITIDSWQINWGDGHTDTLTGNPSSANHTYADGSANYTITATAIDDNGSQGSVTKSIYVNNLAPTVTLGGNDTATVGEAYTLTLGAIADVGADTLTSCVINWDDGETTTLTAEQLQQLQTTGGQFQHVYRYNPGTFITVDLADEDGVYTRVARKTIVVVATPMASMIKDIETVMPANSSPHDFATIGNTMYFVAASASGPVELWKTDGTEAGTVRVKNINCGLCFSGDNYYPSYLTVVDQTLFFAGDNGNGDTELWKSDGTEAGTVCVKDIYVGSVSRPSNLTNVNGILFFTAFDSTGGQELWKSDGTEAGTVRVKDIYAGTSNSSPSNLRNVNGTLFFTANDSTGGTELWKSDGTESGTVRVKDIYVGTNGSSPGNLTNVNGVLFFTATDSTGGTELWKSDGTESGTVRVKDIYAGTSGSYPQYLTNVNGTLFFAATDSTGGTELWKSDGTAAGTVRVKDIYAGTTSSGPTYLTNVNGTLFFTATDSTGGTELWKSDGTESGTVCVKDIYVGTSNSSPQNLTNVNGILYFTATDATGGRELWKSDGTEVGTVCVKDIYTGTSDSNPYYLTNVNGTLFFIATDSASGRELWKSDGTFSGTVRVKDIYAGTSGSNPSNLTNVNGTLFFTATDSTGGTELWKSDGTESGTVRVKDIYAGTNNSNPSNLTNVNGTLFFTATDSTGGTELWKSDGTESGTVRVKDIYVGTTGSYPSYLTNVNGTLFFAATDSTGGQELWKSDGTESGTVRVKDIWAGTSGSYPQYLTNVNGTLFFTAADSTGGYELWKSDGTAAGTVRVKDIYVGTSGSNPQYLTNVDETLFFAAADSSGGTELWKSDGTITGTICVKDIYAGVNSSSPLNLTNVNGTLFFTATDSIGGRELWKSNGTESSTICVRDINSGASNSSPYYLTDVNGILFFNATDSTGSKLWKSDGTEAGTNLVKNISAGTSGISYTSYPTNVNGTLFFAATNATGGTELWKSDGTTTGTVRVQNVRSGIGSSYPTSLVNINGALYFNASNGTDGAELWALHLPVAEAGSYTVAEGESVVLSAASSTGGGLLSYAWDLDGDGIFGETGTNANRGDETGVSPTFLTVGQDGVRLDGPSTYTVSLRVTDGIGVVSTDSADINVTNVAPQLDASGNLVGYWKMDETSGTTASDSSGNGHNGTLINGATWDSDGEFNGAVTLNGVNSYVSVPDTGDSSLEYREGELTLSAWVYISSTETTGGNLISKAWNGSGQYNYRLMLTNTNRLGLFLCGATDESITSDTSLSVGAWHHVVATVDSSKLMTLYVDGINVKSGYHTSTNWNPTLGDWNRSLAIGTLYPYGPGWVGSRGQAFDGKIDDVRILKRALTANEVLELLQGGPNNVDEGQTRHYTFTATDPGADTFLTPTITVDPALATVSNLQFNNTTGVGSFDVAFHNGPASLSITIQVQDSDGLASNIVSIPVTVNNVAPTVIISGPSTVNQGETKHFTFVASDPGLLDTLSLVSVSGDSAGTVSNWEFNSSTRTGSFDVSFGDGTTTSTLSIQVQDSDGALSTVGTFCVTVADPAPQLMLNGEDTIAAGETYTLTLGPITNPGFDTITGCTVRWDDGQTTTLTEAEVSLLLTTGCQVQHVYRYNPGTFISVDITDDDGIHTRVATKAITVVTTPMASMVKDIEAIMPASSSPHDFVTIGNTMYFVAASVSGPAELWKTDGTEAGTVRVKNINCGFRFADDYYYSPSLTNVNGTLFFVGDDGDGDTELWKSDGTEAGTVRVKDIYFGTSSSNPSNLTNVNGTLFFAAADSTGGSELWKSDGTEAGTVRVKDINAGTTSSGPTYLTSVNGILFFSAIDSTGGRELWKSDGTAAGTVRVKDIYAGTSNSNPSNLMNVNGMLFFAATDSTGGTELWKSDGTEAGTVRVKDIYAGTSSSSPSNFTNVNGTLFFAATDSTGGQELWKSDGTESGTVRVKDIYAGTSGSSPFNLTNVNGALFFTATDSTGGQELWKSDGTEAGTIRVKDIYAGTSGSSPSYLTNLNGTLFFVATDSTGGTELWKSDGTESGTVQVKDIYAGTSGSSPSYLTNVNGTLFFATTDSNNERELWKSDGTESGTVRVKDIYTGTSGSNLQYLTNVNGTLFFRATDSIGGQELWKSDGTEAGTIRVKDIAGDSEEMTTNGGFEAGTTTGWAVTPGTYGSATVVSTEKHTGTYSCKFVHGATQEYYTPRIYKNMTVTHSSATHELSFWTKGNGGTNSISYAIWDVTHSAYITSAWIATGVTGTTWTKVTKTFTIPAGCTTIQVNIGFADATNATAYVDDITLKALDVYTGTSSSSPSNLTNVNGTLFFAATASTGGAELWKSDGTESGTVRVKDIYAGTNSSNPSNLTNVNGTLFFTATDSAGGTELWKSDGTEVGTVRVKDIYSGTSNSNPSNLTNVNGTLFFTATDSTGGMELWKSNGTEAGTVRVKDIYSGTSSSSPSKLTNVNGMLFFIATDSTGGQELWKSDGTEAGTVCIKDIYAGTSSSNPQYLTNVNGTLFFTATDSTGGTELWKSDGTESGTVRVKDIYSGTSSSSPSKLTNVNGTLFFIATDSTGGQELWKSDGTESGTVRVKDIFVGIRGSNLTNLTNVNGTLFFTATDANGGSELWKSDGTESGTVRVQNIRPSIGSSLPASLVNINNTLYFSANNGTDGAELWALRLPVAEAGSYTVAEGESVALSAASSTGGGLLSYAWDLDGDGIFGETGTNANRGDETGVSPTFLTVGQDGVRLDGPSTYTVSLRVTDGIGVVSTDTSTINVTNVAPTLSTVDDQTVVEGAGLSLTDIGIFTDPGFANPLSNPPTSETFTYSIAWGDNSTSSGNAAVDVVGGNGVLTQGSFDGSHSYTQAGVYTVTITVSDDDGGSDTASFFVYYGIPTAPTSLSVTSTSNTTASLAWTCSSTSELGFVIEKSTDGTSFENAGWAAANSTNYVVTGLTLGTTYWFRVMAYNDIGPNTSSAVSASTTSTAPSTPSNVAATATSSTQINLTWTEDSSSQQEGFKIEKSTDGQTYTLVTTVDDPDCTSSTITSLSPTTTYYFRVVAYSGTLTAASSVVSAKTVMALPVTPTDLTAAAVSGSKSQINLTWENGVEFSTLTSSSTAPTTTFTQTTDKSGLHVADTAATPLSSIIGYGDSTIGNDYAISGDVTFDNTTTALGFIARADVELGNGYVLSLDPTTSSTTATFRLVKLNAGASSTTLATTVVPNLAVSANDTFHMTFEVNGSSLTGKLYTSAGLLLATVVATDSSYATGKMGTWAGRVSGSIDGTWANMSLADLSQERGYRVEISTDSGTNKTYTEVGTTWNTSYTVANLAPGTTYYFRVVAYNDVGESSYSATANAVTTAVTAAPSATPVLTAVAASTTATINLSWTYSADDESGFKVEQSTDGTNYSEIGTTLPNCTTWTVTGLLPITRYYYRIRAYNNYNGTSYSAYATANTWTANNVAVPPTVATAAASSLNSAKTIATLTALGADGNASESTLTYTWTATMLPTDALAPEFDNTKNGTNAGKSITATFSSAGTYWLMVTITDATGLSTTSSVAVTVDQIANESSLAISPTTSVSLNAGGTQQFTVSGTDQFGDDLDLPITWSATAGTIDVNGLYTAPNSSTSGTVTATIGGHSISQSVTITNNSPTVPTAAAAVQVPATATISLSALGADSDPTGEAGLTYTWTAITRPSLGESEATVEFSAVNGTNAGKNTVATVNMLGTYKFRVTVSDGNSTPIQSEVQIEVVSTLSAIAVSPATTTVNVKATQQFTAIAYDQFGTAMSTQPTFTWSATSGTIDSDGLFTAPSICMPTTVTATSGGVSGSSTIVINDPSPITSARTGDSWLQAYWEESLGSLETRQTRLDQAAGVGLTTLVLDNTLDTTRAGAGFAIDPRNTFTLTNPQSTEDWITFPSDSTNTSKTWEVGGVTYASIEGVTTTLKYKITVVDGVWTYQEEYKSLYNITTTADGELFSQVTDGYYKYTFTATVDANSSHWEFVRSVDTPVASPTGDGVWGQNTATTDTITNNTNIMANTRTGSRGGSGSTTWSYPGYSSSGYDSNNSASNSFNYSINYTWSPTGGWTVATSEASTTKSDGGHSSTHNSTKYTDSGIGWSCKGTVYQDSDDTWSYSYTTYYQLSSTGAWQVTSGTGGSAGDGWSKSSYDEKGNYWPSKTGEEIAGTYTDGGYDKTTYHYTTSATYQNGVWTETGSGYVKNEGDGNFIYKGSGSYTDESAGLGSQKESGSDIYEYTSTVNYSLSSGAWQIAHGNASNGASDSEDRTAHWEFSVTSGTGSTTTTTSGSQDSFDHYEEKYSLNASGNWQKSSSAFSGDGDKSRTVTVKGPYSASDTENVWSISGNYKDSRTTGTCYDYDGSGSLSGGVFLYSGSGWVDKYNDSLYTYSGSGNFSCSTTSNYAYSGTGTAKASGRKESRSDDTTFYNMNASGTWQTASFCNVDSASGFADWSYSVSASSPYSANGTGWSVTGTQSNGAGTTSSYEYQKTASNASSNPNGTWTYDGYASETYGTSMSSSYSATGDYTRNITGGTVTGSVDTNGSSSSSLTYTEKSTLNSNGTWNTPTQSKNYSSDSKDHWSYLSSADSGSYSRSGSASVASYYTNAQYSVSGDVGSVKEEGSNDAISHFSTTATKNENGLWSNKGSGFTLTKSSSNYSYSGSGTCSYGNTGSDYSNYTTTTKETGEGSYKSLHVQEWTPTGDGWQKTDDIISSSGDSTATFDYDLEMTGGWYLTGIGDNWNYKEGTYNVNKTTSSQLRSETRSDSRGVQVGTSTEIITNRGDVFYYYDKTPTEKGLQGAYPYTAWADDNFSDSYGLGSSGCRQETITTFTDVNGSQQSSASSSPINNVVKGSKYSANGHGSGTDYFSSTSYGELSVAYSGYYSGAYNNIGFRNGAGNAPITGYSGGISHTYTIPTAPSAANLESMKKGPLAADLADSKVNTAGQQMNLLCMAGGSSLFSSTLSGGPSFESYVGSSTNRTYDAAGRLTRFTDGNSGITSFSYDVAGNLTSLTDAVGNSTTWTYDDSDHVTSKTDALGNTSQYVYNADGNLVRFVNANGAVRDYAYDANDNVVTETWYASVTDADAQQNATNTISYTYDSSNRMLSETDDGSSVVYAYNEAGQITSITQSSDLLPTVVFAYAYNAAGECSSISVSVDGMADYVDEYSYDADGRLTAINRHGVTGGNAVAHIDVALSYNDAGQVASISRYQDDVLTVTADYTYNADGLLVGLVYHQGDTVLTQYTFSGVAWDATAAVSPLLPGEGQGVRAGQSMLPVHETSEIAEAIASSSSSSNLLTTVTSSDGTVTYTYDAIGQLLSATYSNESIADETYMYDANGNRTTVTSGSSSSTYTTGTDNQLLSDGTYRYSYDAEGNRIAKFIDTDADGLLDQGDTNITQYTWDARNRLMEVTSYATYGGSASQVVDYYYDAENRWIAETIDSDGDGQIDRTLGFVYDDNQVVLQFEKLLPSPASGRGAGGEGGEGSSGATALTNADLSHRYLWQANAVDQLLADEALSPLPLGEGQGEGGEGGSDGYDLTAPGDVLFALTDHLGTVRDLATYDNGVTSIANHRVYDSFGNLKSETNAAVDCLFGFTGRAYDENSGLQNNLNRWYDSKVGRWASEDPIGFMAGDTNTSRYVGNSPMNATDPTGLNRYLMMDAPGHMYLIVDVWDAAGKKVIGHKRLDFWLFGYTNPDYLNIPFYGHLPQAPVERPKNGIVSTIKSDAAADKALLDQWERMSPFWWGGYTPFFNCWSASMYWLFYGMPNWHSPEPSNPYCFESGTFVATPAGKRPIEELKPKDRVFAYHSDDKSVVERQVLCCHSREVDDIYELRIGTEVVCVTGEHPFYVIGRGWTRVADLVKGDMFLTRDGDQIELGDITRVTRRVCVYNLTVEGEENYFVGTNEVLVHNKPAW